MQKKLEIAAIGCGARSTTYLTIAAKLTDQYKIVAAADPITLKVENIKKLSNNPDFRSFSDAGELLREEKMADVLIIGTQDKYHFGPCKKALLKGYDILLEKPIATSVKEIVELQELASRLGRKVMVCFVLRYTPFYKKIKEIIDSGEIGEITSLNASEGIEPWHMGHSFVRGHWSKMKDSTPTIVAKSCHDTDIIQWLIGKECEEVHSYGELSYFTKKNMPKGAPKRCTDRCPVEDECMFNSKRYASDKREPWLEQVYPRWKEANQEEIMEWLRTGDWGRCVYQCDNDAVDSQTVHMKFEDNVKATFTMTAFDLSRNIEIFGTKGCLRGGEFYKKIGADIFITNHASEQTRQVKVDLPEEEGYGHHMGGDAGIVNELYRYISDDSSDELGNSFIHSHVMAFAAEKARVEARPIDIQNYYEINRVS